MREDRRRYRRSLAKNFREEASRRIISRALSLSDVRNARNFFVYVSIGSEVSTHDLIRALLARHMIVTVPFITEDGRMVQRRLVRWAQLTKNRHGFLSVPYGDTVNESPDICIVPGLAFCPTGARLGTGGGHFDRYFSCHSHGSRIALAYEGQIVPFVPVEAHDRRMHVIVTERCVRICAPRTDAGRSSTGYAPVI